MQICNFNGDRSQYIQLKIFPNLFKDFNEKIKEKFIKEYLGLTSFVIFYKIEEQHFQIFDQETYKQCLLDFSQNKFKRVWYSPNHLNSSVRPNSFIVYRASIKKSKEKIKEAQDLANADSINKQNEAGLIQNIKENSKKIDIFIEKKEIVNENAIKVKNEINNEDNSDPIGIDQKLVDILNDESDSEKQSESQITDTNSKRIPDPYNLIEFNVQYQSEILNQEYEKPLNDVIPEISGEYEDTHKVLSEYEFPEENKENLEIKELLQIKFKEENSDEKKEYPKEINDREEIEKLIWEVISEGVPSIAKIIADNLTLKTKKSLEISNMLYENRIYLF